MTNSVPSSAERAYLKAGIGRDRLRVDQEIKEVRNEIRLEFAGVYRQRQIDQPDPPTQLPTQNSYPWYSVPPILLDGGRGGRI